MNTTLTQCDASTGTQSVCKAPQQSIRPRADIYELDDAWFLVLEMPGVDENGTDVAIEKGVLTVVGEPAAFDTEGFQQHIGSVSLRRYERSFRLPEEVDTTTIDAQVKSGVLRLRLPKAAAALPHKVTVKAG